MSLLGSAPTSVASNSRPSASTHPDVARAGHHVIVGEDVALGVDHDAGAQVLGRAGQAGLEEVAEEAVEEGVCAERGEGVRARDEPLRGDVHHRRPGVLHHLHRHGAAQEGVAGGGRGRRQEPAQQQCEASQRHAPSARTLRGREMLQWGCVGITLEGSALEASFDRGAQRAVRGALRQAPRGGRARARARQPDRRAHGLQRRPGAALRHRSPDRGPAGPARGRPRPGLLARARGAAGLRERGAGAAWRLARLRAGAWSSRCGSAGLGPRASTWPSPATCRRARASRARPPSSWPS